MLYDPRYQIVALLFIIGICIHYCIVDKFPLRIHRYFLFFLILGILHNTLDIIGAYTISYSLQVPAWVNQVVNLAFYQTLLLLPAAFFAYVLIKVESRVVKYSQWVLLLFAPFILVEVLLLLNPITNGFFYFTASGEYFRGRMYLLLLGSGFFYLFSTFITLIVHRKNIRRAEFYAMLLSFVLCTTAVVIQNLYPTVLIIGVALALSLGTVYLTMQNPVEMLDSTTRTFNGNGFVVFMHERILSQKPYQFILLKIDDMHVINNMYGATGGEKLMRAVAQYLQRESTQNTRVFRKLYDSFVLVTEYQDPEVFRSHVQNLRQNMNRLWEIGTYRIQLSVSIAFTFETKHFINDNSAIESFFHAYYALKNQGRGSFIEFDATMIQAMVNHDEVEIVLRDAVEHERVEIHLQPIHGVETDGIVFAEALARIRRSDNQLVMPNDFISIAENNGMISQVSQRVIEKVCHFILDSQILESSDIQRISINVSALECEDEGLAQRILSTLDKHGISPHSISLEITETAAMTSEKLPKLMHELRQQGIIFMLDDLGNGYANVSALLRLPFSYVKISRDTLLKSMHDSKGAVVLEKTMEIIHSLGLKSVAEGAETIEQIEFLKAIGIHYIQGYYYSKPLSTEQFIKYTDQNSIRN